MIYDQLSTLEEALRFAQEISNAGIGGGVLPYKPNDMDHSGIYVPWYGIMVNFLPGSGDRKFYHLRFQNGVSGINVGLVRNSKNASPGLWLQRLALEVNGASKTEPWIVD